MASVEAEGRARTASAESEALHASHLAAGPGVWLPLALVLAAALTLYLPVLRTQFALDDFVFLDQVRSRTLWQALQLPHSNFFRPVSRQLYFWALGGLTRESALAFHIANLLTLLGAIAVLWTLVRRIAGVRAAIVAAAFFALHYASDVSVRWACGSQELLAVLGALAAIHLHVTGRRIGSGLAMLGAVFSKEVVLLTPVVAVLADRSELEPWARTVRRAWPLAAAALIWFIVDIAMPNLHSGQIDDLDFDLVQGPPATLAHLLQVVMGIEWPPGRFGMGPRLPPPLLPTLAALAAIAIVWRRPAPSAEPAGREPAAGRRHALRVAAAWIVLASVPVVPAARIWSSYYYLFAMAGVGLALGVLLTRTPMWAACAALALLSWGSANGRATEPYDQGRNSWTPVSRFNGAYIERSSRATVRYIAGLRRLHPDLPHGSTVFFAGLKTNAGFQRFDGPALRHVYRDSSLRSYFLSEFSRETARSGPLYFIVGVGDTLADMEDGDELFARIALGLIVSEKIAGVRDALEFSDRRAPGRARTAYWLSWVSRSLGDSAAARRHLANAGWPPGTARESAARAPDPAWASARFAAGDTAGAIALAWAGVQARPLDAAAHGILADLLLVRSPDDPTGVIEAFASRVLAPEDPYAWRRWAAVQVSHHRYSEALASFQTYRRFGGEAAAADTEARAWMDRIRDRLGTSSAKAGEAQP